MLKNNISAVFKNKQFNNLITYGVGKGFNLTTPLLVVPYIVYVCGIENFGKTSLYFFYYIYLDIYLTIYSISSILC